MVKADPRKKTKLKKVNELKEKKYNVFPSTSLTIKEELDFLLETLKKHRRKINVAVELGCYAGGTSVKILKVIKKNAILYCVDCFVVNGEDAKRVFTEQVLPFFKNLRLIEKSTHEASPEFTEKIDFLFIDADHQEHSIIEDCADWLPKVRSGGVVAFHDYQHPHFPSVAPKVDEATKGWKTVGIEGHLMIKIKP